jgi:hypothetical protein
MIVTTQNRVFTWNQGSNTMTQISLPVSSGYGYSQTYSVRHNSPADGQSIFTSPQVVPTSGGWIFAIPQSNSSVSTYFYQNGYFNSLSTSLSNIYFIASNGNQVLIKGNQISGTYGNYGFLVINGSTVSNQSYSYNIPSIDWTKAMASYNGKSWMILSNKNLVRFDGTSFQSYGPTGDLFLSLAGNGSGTFLLGGAVSTSDNSSYTNPLTAKLVRVDEGTGYVASTNVNTGSGSNVSSDETLSTAAGYKNRITYRAFFDPNWAWHDNITDPKYTVVAQSNDGVRRIELYINGARQRVCDGKDSKGNVTCVMFIESTGYPYDADVAVNAKITSTKWVAASRRKRAR